MKYFADLLVALSVLLLATAAVWYLSYAVRTDDPPLSQDGQQSPEQLAQTQ